MVAIAWTLVGVPLLWGIFQTIEKARRCFSETAAQFVSVQLDDVAVGEHVLRADVLAVVA
jgi:hypothetical protein